MSDIFCDILGLASMLYFVGMIVVPIVLDHRQQYEKARENSIVNAVLESARNFPIS